MLANLNDNKIYSPQKAMQSSAHTMNLPLSLVKADDVKILCVDPRGFCHATEKLRLDVVTAEH